MGRSYKEQLEVLISCMYEQDDIIVERSRIQTNALIINQCDREQIQERIVQGCSIRKIDTTERGLSRSRNMAIEQARSELCLLCDDDEVFKDNYAELIGKAFAELPCADIIIFRMDNQPCKLKKEIHKLSYLQCLQVSSWQIAFRRKVIVDSGVQFCTYMGAGSGNGGGEENKFLLDCHKKGLKIFHYPVEIASAAQKESTWFSGYDEQFFYQRGSTTRYMLGYVLSVAYAVYYVIMKKSLYSVNIGMWKALVMMLKGILENKISRDKRRKEEQ